MYMRCKQFGFDRKMINQRLAFLRLSKADHKLAYRLRDEVISPNINEIIDRFYETLLFHPESRKWLIDGDTIQALKKTQSKYLLTLGIGFDTEVYFEDRLRIGVIHASIGLPLSTYQGAYGNLIQYIINVIPETIQTNTRDFSDLTNFIVKITSLDITLATETYHFSHMSDLEDEVKLAQSREKKFRSQAETDSLTGLKNRKSSFSLLNEAIGNVPLLSGNLCLLMLDIDHFKKVNDTYGHQAGDEVIKQVAATISKTLRVHDIAGRYGGEEFILGLVEVTQEVAHKIAERLRNCLAEAPMKINGQVIYITASIGLACLGEREDLHSLIKRSDNALYEAKEAGRNRVICSL